MRKIKALFLAANPSGTVQLSLDEEIRLITEKIRASQYRDVIDLKSEWAVRPDDLLQLLNEIRPEIVHFSGHGTKTGEIVLVDASTDAPKPVSTKALESLFEVMKDNIRVVILNACYSEVQANAITQAIDCVIGMSDSIGDKAAIIFAASFYSAIGFNLSVKAAFDQSKTALLLEGIPEENTPVLLCKVGTDPSSIYLLRKPAS